MRIAFVLVLLLAASVRPAWAQDDTRLPSPLQALPARLTPAASTAGAPLGLDLRRNRGLGGFVGAIAGGVAGFLVTTNFICSESGDGQGPCILAGTGWGIALGVIAGAIIGLPDGSPPRD